MSEPIKVLLVEDDKDGRKVMLIALGRLGFRCEWAENGLTGLLAIDRFQPDVILLDLVMPVMDGFEFLTRYTGPIPVIVMSGWTDMKDLPREPYARVLKPTGMSEVAVILRNAVTQKVA